MNGFPRLSIVTCVSGPLLRGGDPWSKTRHGVADHLGQTIESVRAQRYPNLEHLIVLENESERRSALPRDRHLQYLITQGGGRADALKEGLQAATGEILCSLDPGVTLLPGALERVAREINPAQGRHVVLGRNLLVGESGAGFGVEFPFVGECHRDILTVWEGTGLPRTFFWTADAWRRSGVPAAEDDRAADYDLLCRISRCNGFVFVDQPLCACRLDAGSCTVMDPDWIEPAIQVSKRYWGSPAALQFWRLLGSYMVYRLHRQHRAAACVQQMARAASRKHWMRGAAWLAAAGLLGPEVVFELVVAPQTLKWLRAGYRSVKTTFRRVRPLTS